MEGSGCPICSALGGGDNNYWVHVATGDMAEVHLERRSPVPGYCLVVWRHGHVAEPTELDADQAASYFSEVLAVGRAVTTHFAPLKLNYLLLGNTVPHLHAHVIPRYLDGPWPGGPIDWSDIFSAEPRPDGELHEQAAALRHLLG